MRRVLNMLVTALLVLSFCVTAPPASTAHAAASEPKVAIAWSAVSYGTVNYTGSSLAGTAYTTRVDGVEALLRTEFSDVTRIGDSQLASLSELEKYDVVVLPRLLSTTATQRQALRDYAARGGGVVSSFGTSRWDFVNNRSPHEYMPLIYLWQFSDSWDKSRTWEWGELSEAYQIKFNNDPIMEAGYKVVPSGSHPIISMTKSDTGSSDLTLIGKRADYNELVWQMPGNGQTTVLATYATTGNSSSVDDGANGSVAAWASDYYYGRWVYFAFQLHDMAYSASYADATTLARARRLLLNSVRWAGTAETYGAVRKSATLSATAYFSGGKIWVKGTVKNTGSIQLRGWLRAYFYNPSGQLVYSNTAKNDPVPLPPGESYTLDSWQPSIGSPHQAGTWKVRLEYEYYDYFRGGTAKITRYVYLQSNGRSMTFTGLGTQEGPKGNVTPIGTRIAGATRYDTAIELAKDGWAGVDQASKAVILATGASYPDALAASALAGNLDAPILMASPGGLGANIAAELKRLYAGESTANLYIPGGTGAVPDAVVQQAVAAIKSAGVGSVDVTRYGGSNRYHTAQLIAEDIGLPTSGPFADTVIIASGTNFPDALAISPLAARYGIPILPVLRDTVPWNTEAALRSLGAKHAIIVGGAGAVSDGVESWLERNGYRQPGAAVNSNSPDTRLSGANRYSTALEIKRYLTEYAGFDDSEWYMATGSNWPDALCVGPLAAANNYPLVLVSGADLALSANTALEMIALRADPPTLTFVGGDGAVSDYVRGQIRIALLQ